jgi:hypothetical protein
VEDPKSDTSTGSRVGSMKRPIFQHRFLGQLLAIVLLLAVSNLPPTLAASNPAYEVGIFQGSAEVSDGVYSNARGGHGESHGTGHNVHIVSVPEGLYFIQAPASQGLTVVAGMPTNGHGPVMHKQWFMDDLHEGDQVRFSAICDKHGDCTIHLPNPENPEKVIKTIGHFKPASAKRNINGLCDTGKLTPAVEDQICNAKNKRVAPTAPFAILLKSDVASSSSTSPTLATLPAAKHLVPSSGTSVHFVSAPSNADVEVDGAYWGTTPANLTHLAAGLHTVTIKKFGYKLWERKVDLASCDQSFNADLEIDSTKPHITGLD